MRRRSLLPILLFSLAALPAAAQSTVTVVNAATFEARFPVAPGGIAAAFGTFTGATQTAAAGLPWPTELGGARVLVNDVAAPLYFVSTGQINFQVPSATAQGRMTVRVTVGGATVAQGTMDTFAVSPGIFERSARPNPLGAILNQDSSVNDRTNPARRGQVIQIFGTGVGALRGTVVDGAAPPPTDSVARPLVYLGAIEASLQYSGVTNFPGLWQVNTIIPAQPSLSGQVPLVLSLGGVLTNQVTVWVAE